MLETTFLQSTRWIINLQRFAVRIPIKYLLFIYLDTDGDLTQATADFAAKTTMEMYATDKDINTNYFHL